MHSSDQLSDAERRATSALPVVPEGGENSSDAPYTSFTGTPIGAQIASIADTLAANGLSRDTALAAMHAAVSDVITSAPPSPITGL